MYPLDTLDVFENNYIIRYFIDLQYLLFIFNAIEKNICWCILKYIAISLDNRKQFPDR